MSRRPMRSRISWLLALVLLRSLIPAGFMPAWVDGAFTLILCDGHAYSASAGSSAHQHHHHQDRKSRTGGAERSGEDCSYAQSANPALASTLDLTPATVDSPITNSFAALSPSPYFPYFSPAASGKTPTFQRIICP